jgi:hypothetical protein
MKKSKLAVAVAVGTAITTVILSMILNSWAFTQTLEGFFGLSVGTLLPLWVLALTYMGHYLWPIDRKLGGAAYALAGFALVVSMPHLAEGYGRLGLHWWECWSLAIVTDTAQVLAKLLVITVADRATTSRVRVTKPASIKRQRKQPRPVLASALAG